MNKHTETKKQANSKDHLLAKNMEGKVFRAHLLKFLVLSRMFKQDTIKMYENSVIAYIGPVKFNFYKTGEWFYVSYGMNVFRRRRLDVFFKTFGRYLLRKKDEFYKKLNKRAVKILEDFIRNDLDMIPLETFASADAKSSFIKIHKFLRLKVIIRTGVATLYVSEDLSEDKKEKLINFIKNNFWHIMKIRHTKIRIFETKSSRLAIIPPLDLLLGELSDEMFKRVGL